MMAGNNRPQNPPVGHYISRLLFGSHRSWVFSCRRKAQRSERYLHKPTFLHIHLVSNSREWDWYIGFYFQKKKRGTSLLRIHLGRQPRHSSLLCCSTNCYLHSLGPWKEGSWEGRCGAAEPKICGAWAMYDSTVLYLKLWMRDIWLHCFWFRGICLL